MNALELNAKVEEILKANGLDFRILKLATKAELPCPDGTVKIIDSPYFNLYNEKSGNIIHSVKDSYHVSQNDEIVKAVVMGMESFGNLSVGKAFSVNDGKRVIMQLGVEGLSVLGDGDKIEKYVTIVDSNDGSTGLGVGIGNMTLSCENQFFKFYKAGMSKFRHTSSIDEKIKELPRLISLALSQSMRMVEVFNKFQSTKASRELAHAMVNHLLGYDKTSLTNKEMADMSTRAANIMDSLYDNIEHEMNSKGNTVWGLFSGVTRYSTHDKSVPRRENGRIESLVTGTNYSFSDSALEFALSHANAAEMLIA